jgi:hypothetical protein
MSPGIAAIGDQSVDAPKLDAIGKRMTHGVGNLSEVETGNLSGNLSGWKPVFWPWFPPW